MATLYYRQAPSLFSLILTVLLIVFSATPALSSEPENRTFTNMLASVVQVTARFPFGDNNNLINISQGSGVAISENLVITNCHVLSGGLKFIVSTGKGTAPGLLTAVNIDADLCALEVPDLHSLSVRPAQLSRSLPPLGAPVYAVGAPSGLDQTLSEGIVSGKRTWDLVGLRFNRTVPVVQTTASISLGSSGGGLFDRDGKMVGIVTFMFGERGNLNFAVSAEEVTRTIQASPKTGSAILKRLNAVRDTMQELNTFDEKEAYLGKDKEHWQHRFNVFSLAVAIDLPEHLKDPKSIDDYSYRMLEVSRLLNDRSDNPELEGFVMSGQEIREGFAQALVWAEYARSINPDIPEPYLMLAQIYRAAGRNDQETKQLLMEAYERRELAEHFLYPESLRRELCYLGMSEIASSFVKETPGLRRSPVCAPWETR